MLLAHEVIKVCPFLADILEICGSLYTVIKTIIFLLP